MLLRALEIIEHAKVHIAKVYLDSDRSIERSREYITSSMILDNAWSKLRHEISDRPIEWRVRPFRARRISAVN